MAIFGSDLAKELMDNIGIDISNVYEINIRLDVDGFATIGIKRHIQNDELGKIVNTLERYELKQII